jgi:hypothetical protein
VVLHGLAYRKSGNTAKVTEVYERLKALEPSKADQLINKVVQP